MAQWSEDEAKRLIKQAKSDKDASDEVYREAMELVFPDRENFYRTAEGEQKNRKQWDSTAQVSLIRSANRLSADWTPQFQAWGELGLGPAAEAMDDARFREAVGVSKDEQKVHLEKVTKVCQAVFRGPGFAAASNEMYLDWLMGQGGIKVMPSDDGAMEPILFEAMPISSFYAYTGPNNRLDRWFFWHERRPDAIKQEWKDAEIPGELAEKIRQKSVKNVKLCSVCYRDYDVDSRMADAYRYEVFIMHGSQCVRIVDRTYRTSPFITPRHTTLAGENRGRGPVMFALADIRTANKIVEMTLKGVALAISGVYTATENGVLSPIAIKPLSIIKVRHNGGPNGASLQRLDNPQRIDFGQLLLEQLQQNIKIVLGDRSLPPEAGPVRTATEFVQRARELVADAAGGLGRLYGEFNIPVWQRVIDILERKQVLSSERMVIDQFIISMNMLSPLAKGESMAEVENIVRFIEVLRILGGEQNGDTLVAYEVDVRRATSLLGDLMGVPMSVRNSETVKKKAEDSIAQQTAAAAGADPNEAQVELDQMRSQVEAERRQ